MSGSFRLIKCSSRIVLGSARYGVSLLCFYARCSIYSMKCYKRYGGPLILNSILDADRSSLTLYAMGESGSGAGYE